MSRATEYNLPFLTCSPLVSGVGSRAGGLVLAIKAGTVEGGFGFSAIKLGPVHAGGPLGRLSPYGNSWLWVVGAL